MGGIVGAESARLCCGRDPEVLGDRKRLPDSDLCVIGLESVSCTISIQVKFVCVKTRSSRSCKVPKDSCKLVKRESKSSWVERMFLSMLIWEVKTDLRVRSGIYMPAIYRSRSGVNGNFTGFRHRHGTTDLEQEPAPFKVVRPGSVRDRCAQVKTVK
jgi:hypothetical protein